MSTPTLRGLDVAVPNPDGTDVANASNRAGDTAFATGMAQVYAEQARQAASAYTRGVGFEDDNLVPRSLAGFITARAVRMANNYLQLQNQSTDGASMSYGAGAYGWTTEESNALDEYRRRACSI